VTTTTAACGSDEQLLDAVAAPPTDRSKLPVLRRGTEKKADNLVETV
jgi:hypothetical protein